MTQNKSYYNKKNMNNMINNAKRQAMEMNKKSTNPHCESENKTNSGQKKEELPKNSFNINDLLGNFKIGLNFDEDTLLLAGLIYFLYKQNADYKLLIALLYILLF